LSERTLSGLSFGVHNDAMFGCEVSHMK